MIKPAFVLTSLTLLSLVLPAHSVTEKTDLKYLETKVLYSKKPAVKEMWYDYKRALFLASQENKPVLLSFCKDDNSFCNKMNDKTFKNPKVKKYLEDNFIPVRVDPDSYDRIQANKAMLEKDLVKEYEIEGYPTVAFLSPEGKMISGLTKGFIDADKFLVILKYISTENYKKTTLKNFEKMEKNNQAGK